MSHAFKIEKFMDPEEVKIANRDLSNKNHDEIMASLDRLHKTLASGDFSANAAQAEAVETDSHLKEEIEQKQTELTRLKDEMRSIYIAIDDTKRQILTIKENGTEGQEFARAAEELSAIVKGTEVATNNILHSAESIENSASTLIAAIQDESQQALACEIQENVVSIFENCNFQDLTGQRITKVVKTFCFIEARIMKMMEIWGGAEAFLNVTPEELENRQGDKGLLNGPSLTEDEDVASQDDIDALFD